MVSLDERIAQWEAAAAGRTDGREMMADGPHAPSKPSKVLNVLLAPFVSAGDVHPFIGLGKALRARGHQVTVAANAFFGEQVQREGLDFVSVETKDKYLTISQVSGSRRPWASFRGGVQRSVAPLMRRIYRFIGERYQDGNTVVVAAGFMFGARIAQEKLGVRLATVHLQPCSFRSLYQSPRLPRLPLRYWYPKMVKRGFYRVMEAGGDYVLGPVVNGFRGELGLPPVGRLIFHWWNSPQMVLGLFPDWFAPRQPDWPPQTRLSGFPLADPDSSTEVLAEAEEFVQAGQPPIVFTPGSLVGHRAQFFDASLEACRRLGRRAIFLTRFVEQLPQPLPPTVRHFPYVPLARLLPRCAAVVHPGGIGTIAQAIAAGIPQLLVPIAYDQPDNAWRAEQLGVACRLVPRRYRGDTAAVALKKLLNSEKVRDCCRLLAPRCDGPRALQEACVAIEQLGEKS